VTEKGYAILRGIVSPFQIAAIRRYFRRLYAQGYFTFDATKEPENREGLYCDLLTLYLQNQVGRLLNRVLVEPIKPSYTWVFRYLPGAVLAPHLDRPQCEWNVSLCVDMEPGGARESAWPIYLVSNGEPHGVKLGVGDAVLYSGRKTRHWRDQLREEEAATLCLLHYVPADFTGNLT
jgi:hypothetical protein